jgi:hypothetical protein
MGYEQLLCHLLGDYITQTDWMANNKTKSFVPAFVHALVYSLPFFFIFDLSVIAATVICYTHFVIDRYRLAKHLIFLKNKTTNWSLQWDDCDANGFPKSMPAALSVMLLIVTDNTMHLIINYFAIKYL